MSGLSARWRAALTRRVRGPYQALGRIDARLVASDAARQADRDQLAALSAEMGRLADALGAQQARLEALQTLVAEDHGLLHGELRGVLRVLAAAERDERRELHRVRDAEEYEAAWTDPDPLVSITVVTRDRTRLLMERTLPSLLGQTHSNLEVIITGDAEGPETAEALASLGDPRVHYANLTHRIDLGPDPHRRWMVAATLARNEATRRATGRWLVCFDDDDALRPHAIETLLERARETRAEVAFGRTHATYPDGSEAELGVHPPQLNQWTFASALYHAGLACFERELVAAVLSQPGDWFTAERMLRAGVRFAHVPQILADIYPAGPRPAA